MKMKKYFIYLMMAFAAVTANACGNDDPAQEQPGTEQPEDNGTSDVPSGNSNILIAYFSATGNTQTVAQHIADLLRADIFRIEAADEYNTSPDPYADSERIQDEAYNNLRPDVKTLPEEEDIAAYDTIFVGSPIWWHQPAMVVCTFLEHYDLSGKVIIPFFTYGATTYLNEAMQRIYDSTPKSIHIPETLPEDIDPDNIQEPQNDDAGINMPGRSESSVENWLREIGIIK